MDIPVYVTDAHPLVWYIAESQRLSSTARQALLQIEHSEALGIVPTIVLAELVHLGDRKRIPITATEIISWLRRTSNFRIVSLDLKVIFQMVSLTNFEIHDRVIVATTKSFEASLITKDEHIQKSGAVPCIW